VAPEREKAWIEAAAAVRKNAVCARSGFAVGAALEAEDGTLFTGCNVENSTYGLTVCAERVAVWKALSEGVRRFKGIAVVTDAADTTPPCGACRQILWEFAGDIPVVMATVGGARKTMRLSRLFPEPFEF
jgi:cytidine deaminase